MKTKELLFLIVVLVLVIVIPPVTNPILVYLNGFCFGFACSKWIFRQIKKMNKWSDRRSKQKA